MNSSFCGPRLSITYIVCTLIFAGFIFRGFAIFLFLNLWLLYTVVLKYSRSESVYRNSIWQLQRIHLKMSSYRMESSIRGFRIYKVVWMPFFGKRLGCAHGRDPFTVAMKRGTETVGHVPRTISYVCTLFLRQRGSISCEVTGSSRPSVSTYRHFSRA